MSKEKIIYYTGGCIILLAFVAFAVYFVMIRETRHWYIVLSGILFLALPLEIWYARVKEKQNPLNQERLLKALEYAEKKKYGLKSEFIQENSTEIYKHFINRGFIHECLMLAENNQKENPRWEVTLLGIKTKKFYE